jgi:hypothetical protein
MTANPVNLSDEISAASATALLLMKSGKFKDVQALKIALQEDYPGLENTDVDQAIAELGRILIKNDFQGIRSLRKNSSSTQREHQKLVAARLDAEAALSQFPQY